MLHARLTKSDGEHWGVTIENDGEKVTVTDAKMNDVFMKSGLVTGTVLKKVRMSRHPKDKGKEFMLDGDKLETKCCGQESDVVRNGMLDHNILDVWYVPVVPLAASCESPFVLLSLRVGFRF